MGGIYQPNKLTVRLQLVQPVDVVAGCQVYRFCSYFQEKKPLDEKIMINKAKAVLWYAGLAALSTSLSYAAYRHEHQTIAILVVIVPLALIANGFWAVIEDRTPGGFLSEERNHRQKAIERPFGMLFRWLFIIAVVAVSSNMIYKLMIVRKISQVEFVAGLCAATAAFIYDLKSRRRQ